MRGHSRLFRAVNIRLLFVFGLSINSNGIYSQSTEMPCHFLDSINITDGTLQPNKSITFHGMEFSETQYAEIDYILMDGTERSSVATHIRGCLCNLKPCLRFCCPLGSYVTSQQSDCHRNQNIGRLEGDIVEQNNTIKHVQFDQYFGLVEETPCQSFYSEDKFQIAHVRIAFCYSMKLISV